MENNIVVGLFIVGIIAILGYSKYGKVKAQAAYDAAKKTLTDKITELETQISNLKK